MHRTQLSYGSLSAKSILITIHSWINCPSYKINVTGSCTWTCKMINEL